MVTCAVTAPMSKGIIGAIQTARCSITTRPRGTTTLTPGKWGPWILTAAALSAQVVRHSVPAVAVCIAGAACTVGNALGLDQSVGV